MKQYIISSNGGNHMIKNMFLDAGGVILNENEFENNSAKIISEIINRYNENYSIKNYWEDIEESIYRFVPKVYDYVLYKNIENMEKFTKAKMEYKGKIKDTSINFELMDGIIDFLTKYSKYYKIGILGQYGKDFRKFLENKDVIKYFTYTETQDDYNITKPDPRYYEEILKKCNCRAEESIMVGDRIDKDIIPAKMVGMKTIRIRAGIYKNQEARTPEEIAEITVNKLEEIKDEQIEHMK
jgi:8-oxo-dGTP diphosphatase/putative hydrolase of the HAD superfamily